MNVLYLECAMGAAGDMLMAALLALHPQPDAFLKELNGLGIPGVTVHAESKDTCGIVGTHILVRVHEEEEKSQDVQMQGDQVIHQHDHNDHNNHDHDHHCDHKHHHDREHHHDHDHDHDHHHDHDHTHDHHHDHALQHPTDHQMHDHVHPHATHTHGSLRSITDLLSNLPITDTVRQNALSIYRLIAEAEQHAHNVPMDQIHFHEVGTMDAVADIVGVCMLMEQLAPERVLCSPIHVGSGHVRCAHGILPVPAPATATLLHGIPIYSGAMQGELCTPTGAAILKHFVHEFGSMPVMSVSNVGYGVGIKVFKAANCVRAFWGTVAEESEQIITLACNIDDMTAEAIGFAQQQLFAAGALDVFTMPIGMKKNRPGIMLSCLCRTDQKETMITVLFRHTTTLGIRETQHNRYTLHRAEQTVKTPLGDVRVKIAKGYGVHRVKPEYDDVARIAQEQQLSLSDVLSQINEMNSTL